MRPTKPLRSSPRDAGLVGMLSHKANEIGYVGDELGWSVTALLADPAGATRSQPAGALDLHGGRQGRTLRQPIRGKARKAPLSDRQRESEADKEMRSGFV